MTSPESLPAVNPSRLALVPADADLTTEEKVAEFLARLLPAAHTLSIRPADALLPWVCDRLPSQNSRAAYGRDLAAFIGHMRERGVDPIAVTGDDVRVYKAAMLAAGKTRTTVARVLSVLRGTYQQFGKKGLVEWNRVPSTWRTESILSPPPATAFPSGARVASSAPCRPRKRS